jgi:FkbM family methyltransferase
MRTVERVRALVRSLTYLGARGAFRFWGQWLRLRWVHDHRLYNLTARGVLHPLFCRANTSDSMVFRQIFLDREYDCVDGLADVGLIIDCGANAGYTSVYCLSKFPSCKVIAVEPDPETFAILQRNLQPYGERATAVHSGIWSKPAGLVIVRDDSRGAWAHSVREATSNEQPDVIAVDIQTLMETTQYDRVSLLKVDIEGSEAEVFASGHEEWLECVDNIVIELHGDRAATTFRSAVQRDFLLTQTGAQTTVATRSRAIGGGSSP